mgnify:CR=1 FL=1
MYGYYGFYWDPTYYLVVIGAIILQAINFSLNFLGEGIGDAFNPKKTRG